MKKVFLIFLALFTTFALTAAPDLDGRVLKIGTDATYPPLETVDEITGEIVGFDVDIINAICEQINCVANFVSTAWDGIFTALSQGEFDIVISGVSITEERDKIVDFSEPYIIVSQSILLNIEDEALTEEDFRSGDLTLAAQTGTTNAALAEEIVGRDNIKLFDTFAAAVLALQNNDVDGVIIDSTSAAAYEQQFAGELVVGITGLQADPLGIVFQEGDELVDAFNEGLKIIQEDGTIDELTAKYWSTDSDEPE